MRIVDKHRGELQTAATEGDLDAVRQLINSGADVNRLTKQEEHPTDSCHCCKKNLNIINLLLDEGAKVDFSPDAEGPLGGAMNIRNIQITGALLNASVDMKSRSQKPGYAEIAIYEALRLGGIDVIEMLLAKGANCNIIGRLHGTPLQSSVPNRGPTGTAGITPRKIGQDGTARSGPVPGKLPRRLPSSAMAAGPGTLFLYQHSQMH